MSNQMHAQHSPTANMLSRQQPFILAIGGGKGGVGKSFVSSNLAVQYAQAGLNVILLDLDFGAANLHTIFGLRQPKTGLGDYFLQDARVLEPFLIETGIKNLRLLPSSGFIPELANIKYAQKVNLIEQIKLLSADLIILDLAAGTASNVIDFFTMTHAGIVVATPEPTAIVNAYEFLKNAIYRMLFRMFRDRPKIHTVLQTSFIPQNALNIATLTDLIQAVKKIDPWAAETIIETCQDMSIHLVLNQARQLADVMLGQKLHGIAEKHLHLQINYPGIIFYNEEVSASVFKMNPLSICNPTSISIVSLKRIALIVLDFLQQHWQQKVLPPITVQMQTALKYARFDFEKNLLLQKQLQRQQFKNYGLKEPASADMMM